MVILSFTQQHHSHYATNHRSCHRKICFINMNVISMKNGLFMGFLQWGPFCCAFFLQSPTFLPCSLLTSVTYGSPADTRENVLKLIWSGSIMWSSAHLGDNPFPGSYLPPTSNTSVLVGLNFTIIPDIPELPPDINSWISQFPRDLLIWWDRAENYLHIDSNSAQISGWTIPMALCNVEKPGGQGRILGILIGHKPVSNMAVLQHHTLKSTLEVWPNYCRTVPPSLKPERQSRRIPLQILKATKRYRKNHRVALPLSFSKYRSSTKAPIHQVNQGNFKHISSPKTRLEWS